MRRDTPVPGRTGVKPGGSRCPDCGKIRYLTRKEARRAVRWMHTHGDSRTMHAYRCGDFWHLTTQPAAVIAARRERAS